MILVFRTILTIIGSLFFLFFFWKKLKDDYSQAQVFTVGFYSLFGLAFGFLISFFYFKEYWFWTSFLGSITGLMIGMMKFKLRFFETLEGWVVGNLFILTFFSVNSLVSNFSLIEIINGVVLLVLLVLFFYINRRYKRYVWYKSGKVGFSGLLVAGLYFVFRTSNALFSGIMTWVGIVDILFSAIIAFGSFMMLYNLSRKEIE